MTVRLVQFKAAYASPDDAFAAVVVPVDAPVELAAFSADDHLGEAVVAGVDTLLAGRGAVDISPSDELLLNLHEQVFWNNRFMVVLDVVLRENAVVFSSLCRNTRGGTAYAF